MTVRNLQCLFAPKSVAVIGASPRPQSLGAIVMRNLVAGGFAGPILPVNPKRRDVEGRRCYGSVAELPEAPQLAVVCTPPATVPGLIAELGVRGTKAAVVLTAGLAAQHGPDGKTLTAAMLEAARPHTLRILGPNCVGLLVPHIGLNASFAHASALPGRLAMVAQSGALTTAMLDWATSRGIGFSHFISLGESADVDFGDVIDYLGSDPHTRSILLYIEAVSAARKFMSAARAASRNKPLIAVKAGREAAGAKAATSHTGALAGSDEVYEAALRRAGMLRVNTTLELFDAAETLARAKPLRGDRLAILTNGGGPGVMAADALVHGGGQPATLSDATIERLDAVLPPTWSHGNPVDIIGDAPADRYAAALEALLADRQVDAVLFIHAPTAIVPSEAIARACERIASATPRTVLSCWLGAEAVRGAERVFREAGIPTYSTPEEGVRAFLQLARYRANQAALMETPQAAAALSIDAKDARETVEGALAQGRAMLTEPEVRRVIGAYGIPVVKSAYAAGVAEAAREANNIGYPVALKIVSPEITHKSEVGGVALGLEDDASVAAAAHGMRARCAELRPDARLEGFTVQKMVDRSRGHELIAGIARDAVFGPIILFGEGGTAVEVIADRAIALPPLNRALARQLVARARVTRRLAGYRDRPPIDFDALYDVLVRLSQLVIDLPEVEELDVNPLLVDEKGLIALDARVKVSRVPAGTSLLSIRPYPGELEEAIEVDGARLVLRPIRPEDEAQHARFLARVSPADIQLRFFHAVGAFEHTQLARLTQIDYDREMAIIAVEDAAGVPETMGVVRAIADADHTHAEFAILVRTDWKGRGLGGALMRKIVRYCREQGMREIVGDVLWHNTPMLALARRLGFRVENGEEPGVARVRLALG